MDRKSLKLEKEIVNCINDWAYGPIAQFFIDVAPLMTLYASETQESLTLRALDETDRQPVKLMRAVYLLSKIAENHAGKLAILKSRYPKLYERMENQIKDLEDISKNIIIEDD